MLPCTLPNVRHLCSCGKGSSDMVMKGSRKTSWAVSNSIPCLSRFSLFLSGFHVHRNCFFPRRRAAAGLRRTPATVWGPRRQCLCCQGFFLQFLWGCAPVALACRPRTGSCAAVLPGLLLALAFAVDLGMSGLSGFDFVWPLRCGCGRCCCARSEPLADGRGCWIWGASRWFIPVSGLGSPPGCRRTSCPRSGRPVAWPSGRPA